MQNAVAFGLNGRRAVLVVVGITALVAPAMAQIVEAPRPKTQTQSATPSTASAEFEVASIRPNTSDRLPPLNVVSLTLMRHSAAASKNGRFSMRGIGATPLSVLIQVAYDVKDFQLLDAPSWVTSERYDVDARAEGDATFEEMRPMLQSLLADRFNLALRRETRQLPVYELVTARNGLNI